MFEFSIVKHKATSYTFNRVDLMCPYCGHIDSFLHKAGDRCVMCDEELPNPLSLIRSLADKMHYHVMGRTRSVNRSIS